MKPNDAAIRKRTQIAKANKTMFIWIALASVLVGVAAVVSLFLVQNLIYKEKVLSEKQATVTTLTANNDVVPELADEVLVLDTNTDLASVKANESDQTLQVILDALPSEANSFALGASLQNKLLVVDGISVESLQVDPVVGVETLTSNRVVRGSSKASANEITFRFTVTGSQEALQKVLENLERSIRTIHIETVRIEIQSTGPEMTVEGKAFYEPAKTVELEEEVVPR